MVVRVAQRARRQARQLRGGHRRPAHPAGLRRRHGMTALLTRTDHPQRQRPPGRGLRPARLADDAMVVNVQGDEPLMDPALIERWRRAARSARLRHEHRRPRDRPWPTSSTPTWSRWCSTAQTALYFSRAPIAWWRDGMATLACGARHPLPSPAPLRHIGIYGYRAGFLRRFPALNLPRWSSANRWNSCACCGTASASRCTSRPTRPALGWTRPKTWNACARLWPALRQTTAGL
jgi:3-deoxy-manno-octulosonate cytidylyltransferase (CMP-KDO synthetase)